MKKKDFNRFLRRYLKAIIEGKEEDFFNTVIGKKVDAQKINSEQLEELFFYRYFSKTHYNLIKSMIDGPGDQDKQYAALLIGKMKVGWAAHAEVMFNMFHDDRYKEGYLNLIDMSKRKMKSGK